MPKKSTPTRDGTAIRRFQVIKREVKLETMLNRLIERGGYSRNRQPILDSINVTAAALSQYARGRTRPSFEKLAALADFFGVSLDYLVYGEPADTPVDPDPVARYVEQALRDVRSRTNRHSELVARIGRLLLDRINDVAAEVVDSRSAGMEGLIEESESVRVERYCRQADIVTADFEPDITITMDDKAAPGQFFSVVAENLTRGCTYRFLLTGELAIRSPCITYFREMITATVGGDRLHEYCHFREAPWPIAGAPVMYQLDTPAFATEEPALYTQFSAYLLNDTWLGYLNRSNNESTADMLMGPSHLARARDAFEILWSSAST
jgi:transcriptional regulator with XRE-family HTH domain